MQVPNFVKQPLKERLTFFLLDRGLGRQLTQRVLPVG
jgi:hypothetical protein